MDYVDLLAALRKEKDRFIADGALSRDWYDLGDRYDIIGALVNRDSCYRRARRSDKPKMFEVSYIKEARLKQAFRHQSRYACARSIGEAIDLSEHQIYELLVLSSVVLADGSRVTLRPKS